MVKIDKVGFYHGALADTYEEQANKLLLLFKKVRDKMTENDRKTMMIMTLADTIMREISRMCVTKDLAEFDVMYFHARENLGKLSQMIYDNRFKSESEGKK